MTKQISVTGDCSAHIPAVVAAAYAKVRNAHDALAEAKAAYDSAAATLSELVGMPDESVVTVGDKFASVSFRNGKRGRGASTLVVVIREP